MSASVRQSPPWNAYSVSHQLQRSGQPVRRTNTLRQPTASASPCREWKISLTRRRVSARLALASPTAATGAATVDMRRALPARFELQRAQPAFGQPRDGAVRIARDDIVQGRLGVIPLLEFVLRVAGLQQRFGRLLAVRIARQQLAE